MQKYFNIDSSDITGKMTEYAISLTMLSTYCPYWLRTMGCSEKDVTFVALTGVYNHEGCAANTSRIGVRPAMWIEFK